MQELTHLSLFTGIGGLDLAAEAAGFETVGQCEWADYPTKILEKHWPDVARWRDIRTLTGDDFYARAGRRSVTVISGGFPCQPFSVAGKQRGKEDDRYLWPEMLRVISEIRPAWVIGENVPGIINLALDTVLSDLENQGYSCQPFIVPACGVDAPHRRDRVIIVGRYTGSGKCESQHPIGQVQEQDAKPGGICSDVADTSVTGNGSISVQPRQTRSSNIDANGSRENVADANKPGLQRRECGELQECTSKRTIGESNTLLSDTAPQQRERDGRAWERWAESANGGWWPAEPDVGRVANGVPNRVDRLKCLGNAVVPAQFYPFFKYIAEIQRQPLAAE